MSTLVTRGAAALFATVILSAFLRPAIAQGNRVNLNPVEFDGTFSGLGPNGLIFKLPSGAAMIASIDPTRPHNGTNYVGIAPPKVTITGAEKKEFLIRGMLVRVSGLVERRKRLSDEIKQVTVLSNPSTNPPGIFDAVPPGSFDVPEPKPGVEYVSVVGYISALGRGNSISIDIGGRATVTGQLSNDAQVLLDVSDPKFARPGDPIHVVGLAIAPDTIFATEVSIKRQPAGGVAAIKPPAAGGGAGLFATEAAAPGTADKPAGAERVRGVILKLN